MDALLTEFDSFVRTRTPALLRSAYLLTGDQHLAEDLVQSALARTHRSWRRLHHSGNAEAYTRKVMYHLQVSWWRRRRIAESMPGDLPEPSGGGSAPDHAQQTTLRLTLRAALQKLSARQRAVLVLRFYEDRSETEAAELLGVTVGTVKSQTSKALARLRTVAPEIVELYVLEGSTR
ncbi:SigE family RNA polymerase sigma factor [Micromonospora echinofusca]|uniref:SigE family RNA polymerase sigma factor n=1 Tax=Micromonospora echinofusca TaxID=47858 RepID=A0ABS3VJ38_MICEH|nr:SigE family RNA polymerase sigma factor [Micromonospora echinofusca]MBO4204541.1 SigE family RNA polymerase sigma factor [Micromonospora echinofusca]